MANFTANNLLTWDENGTGKLVELDRGSGAVVQTVTLIGAAPTTYACFTPYITALLVNGTAVFGGAIQLVNPGGGSVGPWIAQSAIDDLDDPPAGPGPAALLVDGNFTILYVQQVAPDAPSFKVRKWTLYNEAAVTVTCTFPAEGIGSGSASYRPMGLWQEQVAILGAGISPDNLTLYVLTQQYIYACNLSSGAMSILVDFGGDALMGNGGLAVKANGNIYAGLMEKVPSGPDVQQEYKVNTYFPDGTLIDTKLVATTIAAPYAVGGFSFSQQMALGNGEADLWFFLSSSNDSPAYEDTTERILADTFHGTAPTPPPMMAWARRLVPGMAAKFGPFASGAPVLWQDKYP